MFKKRGQQKQSKSLQSFLTQITTQEHHNIQNTENPNNSETMNGNVKNNNSNEEEQQFTYKKQNKASVYEIGSNPKDRLLHNSFPHFQNTNKNRDRIEEQVQNNLQFERQAAQINNDQNRIQLQQIQECFAQYINSQKQQLNTANNEGQEFENQPAYRPFDEDMEMQHQQNVRQNQQIIEVEDNENDENVNMPIMHEVVVQDQSCQIVEVREDYGEIQSGDQSDNSQQFKDSIQNRMIRQALTKSNYDQLRSRIQPTPIRPQKNKLIKKLDKISLASVQKKMLKDLQQKKSRKNQLTSQISSLQSRIESRKTSQPTIHSQKEKIQNQLKKVEKMLSLLFYFGSEFETKGLKEETLATMVEAKEWAHKLQKVREKVCKNRKQYQNKKNKYKGEDGEQGEDGEEDDHDSKEEESDVELIGKDKYRANWEDQDMGEEDSAQIDESPMQIQTKNKNKINNNKSKNKTKPSIPYN